MTDEASRKTRSDYDDDRRKLAELRAPAVQYTYGSDRDIEYRKDRALGYALDMIGHLLDRVEALEKKTDETSGDDGDVPMGGGIEGPFDPDDRPWQS